MYERWTSSVKRRTNSARSVGVRCAQYCPRDRFAISPKSNISYAVFCLKKKKTTELRQRGPRPLQRLSNAQAPGTQPDERLDLQGLGVRARWLQRAGASL